MLRPTTATEKILYGAPAAHLRLERTDSVSPLVLFAKLPSDVLKAIHLGAPLSLFGSLVPADGVTIPLVGIQIDDVAGDSFVPFQPVVDAHQVGLWCEATGSSQLKVSFVNELVIPVMEGEFAVNHVQGKEFSALFSGWNVPAIVVPESTQERALDSFEKHLKANGGTNSSSHLTVVGVPVKLESKEVLRLSLGTSGDFDLDHANEGANLEQTLQELLASKYPSDTFRNPQVQLDTKKRELTDLLLLSNTEMFIFESKVMTVLERGLDVTAEKRAKRTMKHFQKAIGQLVGAVKQVRSNSPLFTQDGTPLTIHRIEQMDIHALVVVSSANLGLDFRQIAAELTSARSQAPAFYHFLDLSELQQHIAFTDDTTQLSLYLQRRFEVATGSQNAAICTRFMRQPVKPVSSSPIAGNAGGYVFAFMANPRADHDGQKLTKNLFSTLKEHDFCGRFELYHRVLKRGRDAYYDLGVGLAWRKGGQPEIPDSSWWRVFEAGLASLVEPGLGLQLSRHSCVTTLDAIRRDFEPVAVMDMEHGVAVSCD